MKVRDFIFRERLGTGAAPCDGSLHLLCHSMGNIVLQHTLARLIEFSPHERPPRLFDQVFLCAPDVDNDVLEPGRPMERLPQTAQNVTIYHNRDDKALLISDATKGHPDRLGWRGADHPSQLDAKVHQVDCDPIIKKAGFVKHGYHLSGRVNDDIRMSIDGVAHSDMGERDRVATPNGWANVWRLD